MEYTCFKQVLGGKETHTHNISDTHTHIYIYTAYKYSQYKWISAGQNLDKAWLSWLRWSLWPSHDVNGIAIWIEVAGSISTFIHVRTPMFWHVHVLVIYRWIHPKGTWSPGNLSVEPGASNSFCSVVPAARYPCHPSGQPNLGEYV